LGSSGAELGWPFTEKMLANAHISTIL